MHALTILSLISDTRSFFYFWHNLQVNIYQVISFDILRLTVVLSECVSIFSWWKIWIIKKIAVLVSWHSFINDSLNDDKSLSVVFRLSFFFNVTKKRVTVVINRVRRRLKKHMRLVLIVAPVNRHEEQYFTSHTYTCRERERKRNY
jgi:hypothetical protein